MTSLWIREDNLGLKFPVEIEGSEARSRRFAENDGKCCTATCRRPAPNRAGALRNEHVPSKSGGRPPRGAADNQGAQKGDPFRSGSAFPPGVQRRTEDRAGQRGPRRSGGAGPRRAAARARHSEASTPSPGPSGSACRTSSLRRGALLDFPHPQHRGGAAPSAWDLLALPGDVGRGEMLAAPPRADIPATAWRAAAAEARLGEILAAGGLVGLVRRMTAVLFGEGGARPAADAAEALGWTEPGTGRLTPDRGMLGACLRACSLARWRADALRVVDTLDLRAMAAARSRRAGPARPAGRSIRPSAT
jgi:hypothetical protein